MVGKEVIFFFGIQLHLGVFHDNLLSMFKKPLIYVETC